MREKASQAPSYRARKEGLLVHTLDDEVLVYDLERHRAHCLNKAAAAVWERCDGKTSVAQMSHSLSLETETAFDQDMVLLALSQLDKARLLDSRMPRSKASPGISRRDVLKRVGLAAAVAVPLISSVISPTPAEAVTCLAKGTTCATSAQCCSKVCSTGTGKCL